MMGKTFCKLVACLFLAVWGFGLSKGDFAGYHSAFSSAVAFYALSRTF